MSRTILYMMTLLTLFGCSSYPPIKTETKVDIQRFMGDWYVIANIPTFIEKGAHTAVESYELNDDGSIATTFSFRQDGFDGEKKTYNPTGYIQDKESNAIWGMQFIWPFESDYRIIYISKDYSNTIIGRIKRDYVWIMSRTPVISDDEYDYMVNLIKQEGYDITQIRKVPQRW